MNITITRRTRRANRRQLRAALRTRAAQHRLVASCRRKPRSLATHLLASGVPAVTAAECASSLRSVAKRLDIKPAKIAPTKRTATEGHTRARTVHRYTRAQLARMVAAYRPRKAEFKDAIAALKPALAA